MTKESINQRFLIAVNYIVQVLKTANKSDISDKMEISKSKFSEILNGRMNAGIDLIAKFCKEYSINPTWLLLDKGEMILNENTSPDNILQEIQVLSEEDQKSLYKIIDLFIQDSKKRNSEK